MKTLYNKQILLKSAGILLAGIFLGWLLFGGSSPTTSEIDRHIEETHTNEQGEIVYTCSMHPQVRQNEPGNCPICGMELIPVDEADAEEDQHPQALRMTQAAMTLADVQTTTVTAKPATKKVHMPGKVTVDERAISIIPAHFPGRVEELFVNFTGAYIEKGDKLASVYSPDLITAQRELLEAYKKRESNPRLYKSARQKFINWKIAPEVIDNIIEKGEPQYNFDIHSHKSGYVTKRHVAVGDHIHFGKPIFELTDLSSVWVQFNAYESDLQGLSEGDNIQFSVASYPGQTFESEISYIDPLIDEDERTVTVRTELANNNGQLKPNMLAEGTVSASLNNGQSVLQVPKQAVLWTGKRSIVYVKLADTSQTRFEAREIELGARAGDSYIVEDGLQQGEKVVVKGNFMIDSAAQLADKTSMMNKPEKEERNSSQSHSHTAVDIEDNISEPDTTDHQHKEYLATLLDHYLDLKNALTNDEFETAKTHLRSLHTEVMQNSEMNQHHRSMAEAISSAGEAENLTQLRQSFIDISDHLIRVIPNQGYAEELFIQYCPMADNGNGAKWLSDNKKIENPYFGQQMPGCGEVIER